MYIEKAVGTSQTPKLAFKYPTYWSQMTWVLNTEWKWTYPLECFIQDKVTDHGSKLQYEPFQPGERKN